MLCVAVFLTSQSQGPHLSACGRGSALRTVTAAKAGSRVQRAWAPHFCCLTPPPELRGVQALRLGFRFPRAHINVRKTCNSRAWKTEMRKLCGQTTTRDSATVKGQSGRTLKLTSDLHVSSHTRAHTAIHIHAPRHPHPQCTRNTHKHSQKEGRTNEQNREVGERENAQ